MKQPLKWHGGKHYLADWLIGHMPPHLHYVEPFFGGGAVLLRKSPDNVSEVVNDLDGPLTNFLQVLRDDFPAFQRLAECTPFSESHWRESVSRLERREGDAVRQALDFFVTCRQSRAGNRRTFTPLTRNRSRRGMNGEASAWLSAIEGLADVHARLKRVVILNRPAVDCIRSQDDTETLFYLDPPYVHETRAASDDYAHEMSPADHADLLTLANGIKGKAIISGYRNELYDDALKDWRRDDREIDNKVAGGKTKRRMIESVWMNY